jgi:hypothetical protein
LALPQAQGAVADNMITLAKHVYHIDTGDV